MNIPRCFFLLFIISRLLRSYVILSLSLSFYFYLSFSLSLSFSHTQFFEKNYSNKVRSKRYICIYMLGVYRLTGEHTPHVYTSVFLRCMCIDTRECSFSTELSDLLTRHIRLGTQETYM